MADPTKIKKWIKWWKPRQIVPENLWGQPEASQLESSHWATPAKRAETGCEEAAGFAQTGVWRWGCFSAAQKCSRHLGVQGGIQPRMPKRPWPFSFRKATCSGKKSHPNSTTSLLLARSGNFLQTFQIFHQRQESRPVNQADRRRAKVSPSRKQQRCAYRQNNAKTALNCRWKSETNATCLRLVIDPRTPSALVKRLVWPHWCRLAPRIYL
jgi:hypothetical protein